MCKYRCGSGLVHFTHFLPGQLIQKAVFQKCSCSLARSSESIQHGHSRFMNVHECVGGASCQTLDQWRIFKFNWRENMFQISLFFHKIQPFSISISSHDGVKECERKCSCHVMSIDCILTGYRHDGSTILVQYLCWASGRKWSNRQVHLRLIQSLKKTSSCAQVCLTWS